MTNQFMKFTACGEIIDAPRAATTKTGKTVVSATMCVAGKSYVRLAFWEEMADLGGGLKVGEVVAIEGTPRAEVYQKKDGSYASKLTVSVTYMDRGNGSPVPAAEKPKEAPAAPAKKFDDDLPF